MKLNERISQKSRPLLIISTFSFFIFFSALVRSWTEPPNIILINADGVSWKDIITNPKMHKAVYHEPYKANATNGHFGFCPPRSSSVV